MNSKCIEISLIQFNKLYGKFWETCVLNSNINNSKNIKRLRTQYWKDTYGLYYNKTEFDCRNNRYSIKISNKKKLDYARIKYGF